MKNNKGLFEQLLSTHIFIVAITASMLYLSTTFITPYLMSLKTNSSVISADSCKMAARNSMVISLGISSVIAILLSLGISKTLTKPIKRLTQASKRISNGNYDERLNLEMSNEISDLVSSFNEMAGSLHHNETRRIELIANIGHELSTPLSSLQGFIEGMEDGHFEADEATLSACKRQIHRLERVINDLSLLSKVEIGDFNLELKEQDLHVILRRLAMSFEPRLAAKNINLELDISSEAIMIMADSARLEQILNNLITNAIRHSPNDSKIKLATKLLKNKVEISVEDFGEGIAEIDVKHIFKRFYRVDKSRIYSDGQGSGIGLTIAKHYARAHGSELMVKTELGKGSKFYFILSSLDKENSAIKTEALNRPAMN